MWAPEAPFNFSSSSKIRPASGGADGQPQPANEKTDAAKRSDRSQPADIRERQHIERTGKQQDAREKADPGSASQGRSRREHEEHHGVNEMIEHRLLPDRRGVMPREDFFQ